MNTSDRGQMLSYLHEVAKMSEHASISNIDLVREKTAKWIPLREVVASQPTFNDVEFKEGAVLILGARKRQGRVAPYLIVEVGINLVELNEQCDAAGSKGLQAKIVTEITPPDVLSITLIREPFFDGDECLLDFPFEEASNQLIAPQAVTSQGWSGFFAQFRSRFSTVMGFDITRLHTEFGSRYETDLGALVCDRSLIQERLTKGVDELVQGIRPPRLLGEVLHQLGASNQRSPATVSVATAWRSRLLGHMDERARGASKERTFFALDPTQRLAATCAVSMDKTGGARIMPVNGPPGTGKTSFLKAVIASEVVRAAYERRPAPPLIVGAGATNKAVSNLVESISSVAAVEFPDHLGSTAFTFSDKNGIRDAFATDSMLSCRWIDGLDSYAWMYPSRDALEAYPHVMHLIRDWEASPTKALLTRGAAENFSHVPLSTIAQVFLARAASALAALQLHEASFLVASAASSSSPGSQASPPSPRVATPRPGRHVTVREALGCVVNALHGQIVSHVDNLVQEQLEFRSALEDLASIRRRSKGAGYRVVRLERKCIDLESRIQAEMDVEALLIPALQACLEHVVQHAAIQNSWWSALPAFTHEFTIGKQIRKLHLLAAKAQMRLTPLDLRLEQSAPAGFNQHQRLNVKLQEVRVRMVALKSDLGHTKQEIRGLKKLLSELALAKEALLALFQAEERSAHKIALLLREIASCTTSASDKMSTHRQALALNSLVLRHDESQDARHRVRLFHLAARYWEARWVQSAEQKFQLKGSAAEMFGTNDALQLSMHLGFMVVATTTKLADVGRLMTADLLILDEAGQCNVVDAALALSYSHSALMVGDDLQLSPITRLTPRQASMAARRHGLDPLQIPFGLNGAKGSGLLLSRDVACWSDGQRIGAVPSHGVTLLHHYRCHPEIIGYSNELMYDGRIHCKRPGGPTRSQLPALSWENVSEPPERVGKSWVNHAEIDRIVDWLRGSHKQLAEAYGAPLSEVVAIIAPLRGQAEEARRRIERELAEEIGLVDLQKMTIGTVHALQGAERPVVAFTLVQHLSQGVLFANGDAGRLMNVALSRAKDAFVLFGDEASFLPTDQIYRLPNAPVVTPMSILGKRMQKFGRRLNPPSLVIVEAPGKVEAIARALGPKVTVLATGGSLCELSLDELGNMSWSDVDTEFARALNREACNAKELVIATDDDLAGELIGFHVTQALSEDNKRRLQIKRMRFHSLESDGIRCAWAQAGDDFDENMLKSALAREAMRCMDRITIASTGDLNVPYAPPHVRDLVALVEDSTPHSDRHVLIDIEIQGVDKVLTAFIANDVGVISRPKCLRNEEALVLAARINAEFDAGRRECGAELATSYRSGPFGTFRESIEKMSVGPYPPSTTFKILAAAADELNMLPWHAQEHLNAMYLQGAMVNTDEGRPA